jgi:LytR cell envelope-related transcriptional attenuator
MGRHEPPTNRSFYLSMGASTLRFALIVALVVGGIVLINQAFPEASPGTSGRPDDGVGTPESPSPTPTPDGDDEQRPTPSPTVQGTVIAVFNGAGVSELASNTQDELVERFGFVAGQEAADAPAPVSVTTLYWRARPDEIEAENIANEFFRRLDDVVIARLDRAADVDQSVQVAIYLGTDYAQSLND